MSTFLSDDDWRNLLREIRSGKVIPVIGPKLVTVDDPERGTSVPLHEALAPPLARALKLDSPHTFRSLNEVARAYLITGRERQRLYTETSVLLEELVAQPQKALVELAGISDFSLFIATTPDPLLANAVAKARPPFDPERGVIRFHPTGNPNRSQDAPISGSPRAPCDLPPTFKGPLVYHILGDFNTIPDFAIWEEDYLEFICGLLESRDTLENLFRQLTTRDLLFLGAPSDDWIMRFFLRMTRGRRLSDPPKRGYLADNHESLGEPLLFYFDKIAKTTQIINGSPTEFVLEMAARWREMYGTTNDSKFLKQLPETMPRWSVFISYSRDDLATALRVVQSLVAGGIPVWLDRQRLQAGDNYESTLEQAIKADASFFVSLISRATEADSSRYVHRERTWASQRHVDGYVFYLPLIIDQTVEFHQEPACFAKIHREILTDDTLPAFVHRMKRLFQEFQNSGQPRS